MKKVLFVIGFRSFVLNYTYMHDAVLFLICLSKLINYIWFINIILNIMRFFKVRCYFIVLNKRAFVIFSSMRPLVAFSP